jgi:hypothetical protein
MKLKPVDWGSLSKKGCYVYCYLRKEELTPYYIGVGTTAYRPFQEHNCALPSYDDLIRVMRSGLTWDEAAKWEKIYIKRYGRKNNNTGILENLTDGGEGVKGLVITKEHADKIREANRKYWEGNPELLIERGKNISRARMGHEVKASTKAKLALCNVDPSYAEAAGISVEEYLDLPDRIRQRIIYQSNNNLEVSSTYKNRDLTAARNNGVTILEWLILKKLKIKKRTQVCQRAVKAKIPVLKWIAMSKSERIRAALSN